MELQLAGYTKSATALICMFCCYMDLTKGGRLDEYTERVKSILRAEERSLTKRQIGNGASSLVDAFLSSTRPIKSLSGCALTQELALQECRAEHEELSCPKFLKKVRKGEICDDFELTIPSSTEVTCPGTECPYTVPECSRVDLYYRTIDGTCNNLRYPTAGSANRPYQRFLPADYSDCVESPRNVSHGLPSAREISNSIYQSDMLPDSTVLTHLHMSYGQLVDHDIDRTPVAKLLDEENDELVDVPCGEDGCSTQGDENRNCFPIGVPNDDGLFESECIKFVRSDTIPANDCRPGPRQQANVINSWLDASFVYHSDQTGAAELRTGQDGKLKSIAHPFNVDFLPLLPTQFDKACRNTTETVQCFKTGDARQNEQVGLQALHTVFMRYHNYIATELKNRHDDWDDETLYQQSRRILAAVWQNTVFNEYLPPTLGMDFMRKFRLKTKRGRDYLKPGYTKDIARKNPDTSNVFATAAFRFGHSQIQDRLRFADPTLQHTEDVFFTEYDRESKSPGALALFITTDQRASLLGNLLLFSLEQIQVFFNPNRIYYSGILDDQISGVTAVLIGQTNQSAGASDVSFSRQIAGNLFTDFPPHGSGSDLPARNTQRGRDHGIPSYKRWIKWSSKVIRRWGLYLYKMRNPIRFDDLTQIMPQYKVKKLKNVYRYVEDIDLFTGAMLENHVLGGVVGPTFASIIAKQFHYYKFADRFYFEHKSYYTKFTPDQLENIRNQTIASIFCRTLEDDPGNPDRELRFQKYVLLRPEAEALQALRSVNATAAVTGAKLKLYGDEANERMPCSQHAQLDLDLF